MKISSGVIGNKKAYIAAVKNVSKEDIRAKLKRFSRNKYGGKGLKVKVSSVRVRKMVAGNVTGRIPVRQFSNILTGKPEEEGNGKVI
jgi:hypothetical protein